MKKIFIILAVLFVTLSLYAQTSIVSFGLRGGGNLYLIEQPFKSNIGYQGLFDFGYTCIWSTQSSCEIGLQTGISAGYSTTGFQGDVLNQFSNIDYLGNTIQYTTSAFIADKTQQVQLEIPLMLALRAKGFVWNIGPKLMLPLWNTYSQTISNVNIDAYYDITNVHVFNELITGKVDDRLIYKGQKSLPLYNVLVGTELGYEWIKEKHRIGLTIYADMAPWCSHKSSAEPIVNVSPIVDASNPIAQVEIHPLTDAVARMWYVDFGLKFYAGINIPSKKEENKDLEQPLVVNRRDTILQVDTFYVYQVDTVRMMDTVVYVDTLVQHQFVYRESAIYSLQKCMRNLNGLTNHYASGATELPKSEKLDSCLNEIATILIENPYLKIRVVGHTCNTGSHQTNQIVGQKRAMALKQELMEKGVPSSQIITDTMAETQPIVPNDTPQNREQNRRVEVEIKP